MLNIESNVASAKPSCSRRRRNVAINHIPGKGYFVDGRRFKSLYDV